MRQLFIAAACALALASPAQALVFNVNTTVDANDGVCNASHCTLREAIEAAQNNVGFDTINVPAGTYNLTLNAPCGGAFGTFALSDGFTMNGGGEGTTIIDGLGRDRIFALFATGSPYFITLNDLTVQGGFNDEAVCGAHRGGAFTVDGGNHLVLNNVTVRDNEVRAGTTTAYGAGVRSTNGGTLDCDNCTFSNNRVVAGTVVAAKAHGGAIAMLGASGTNLVLNASLIDGNEAIDGTAGTASVGGVFVDQGTTRIDKTTFSNNLNGAAYIHDAYVTESIFHDNEAFADAFAPLYGALGFTGESNISNSTVSDNGAGISNFGAATDVMFCTIKDNADGGPRHGIANHDLFGANTYATATVVDEPLGGCSGTITSFGFNLDRTNTCNFIGGGDVINTDPLLGPLADNGGPTLTHLPATGSPVVDTGPLDGLLNDQRGIARPQDGDNDGTARRDRGAVELVYTAYTATANTMAVGYGSRTLVGSGVINQLFLLLLPAAAYLLLRPGNARRMKDLANRRSGTGQER